MKNKKSFTLVEVIVTITVIGFLSMIVISAYRSSQKRYTLENEIQLLVSNIRRVQNLGLAAQVFQCPSNKEVKGYGIHFFQPLENIKLLKYGIFADCNDNNNYDKTQDVLIDEILVNPKVKIYCQSANDNCSNLDIVVKPPYAQFIISRNLPNNRINFQFADLPELRGYVEVLKSGYVFGSGAAVQ